MPARTAKKTAPRKTAARKAAPKQSTEQSAPLPTPEETVTQTPEFEKLNKPAKLHRDDAEFIDPDPGYSEDQVDHMREYYGLTESTAEVASV